MSNTTGMQKEVTIVFVPADSKLPMREIKIKQTEETHITAVMDYAKAHFEKKKKVFTEEEKVAYRLNIREQLGAKAANIDNLDALIDQMSMSGNTLVEPYALMNNKKATGYMAVMMYLDDMGTAKGLGLNQRASGLAAVVNRPVRVLGDAFIGRYFDDDDAFKRLDFKLSDIEGEPSQTSWVRLAMMTNPRQEDAAANKAEMQALIDSKNLQAPAVPKDKNMCQFGSCQNPGSKRCGRCKQVSYCSATCQKLHWKLHKKQCKPKA